uniref:ATP synthase F0 subunit 8 n=1 Tax=Tremex columba TaxID=222809 RepID=A0A3G5BC66_TRECO|nr:ATP synthase F0 subunit 8 [Tremex columba]AYV97233.1 ATP synthase F0 subunit 8 [Tremex columba]
MPQMSPMSWSMNLIFFNLIFILLITQTFFLTMIFSLNFPSINSSFQYKTKISFWKW